MRVLAIDPGTTHSAWCSYAGQDKPVFFGHVANGDLALQVTDCSGLDDVLAIEMIASYGMPVGREVFETCVWIGRFIEQLRAQISEEAFYLVYRSQVKIHLCHSPKAKDANIRQALIDRFGGKEKAIGKKKTPGPLYGMSGDEWAALAVAVTFFDQNRSSRP